MRAIGYLTEYGSQSAREPAAGAPGISDGSAAPETASGLAAQNDQFLRFCDANGYQPAAAFLDPVPRDGRVPDRPGLRQLLDYLDTPEKGFIAVVISAFQRLGPDRAEAARTYFQIVALGAQVISIADGPVDDARLIEIWSQDDASAHLGARVRDAMRRRAVKGQVLGRPPYGYRVGDNRRLEVIEEEAALVRVIFGLYIKEDLGIRLIAKRLNEQGYRTRRDGNWSMVTIRDLLRNRVYVGTYTRFGVKVPGSHTAIVSEAEFRAVQERMQQRRRPAAKAQPSRFLLSGLVYCGEGGPRMIGVTRRQQWTRRDGEVARNTYRYYQSEARTNQSVGEYHTRRAAELEAEVLAHLTAEDGPSGDGPAGDGPAGDGPAGDRPAGGHRVRPAVLSAGNARAVAAEVAVAESRVRSRMRSLDRRLANALSAASTGRKPPEYLREVAQQVTRDYQHSTDELASIDRRASAHADEGERHRHRERQINRVRRDWGRLSFDERQTLLRDLVERVIVEDDSVQTVLRV